MTNLKSRQLLVIAACVLLLGSLLAMPALGQGNASIKPGETEAADPGFAHNHVGRNIGDPGGLPDSGNYCGPLPGHICHGGSGYFWTVSDPFTPTIWSYHTGNQSAVARAQNKGWPLQTFTVLLPSGEPAAQANVEFFESGYTRKGVRGVTDEKGRFQIAVKKLTRNHRFVAKVAGYDPARLEVLSNQLQPADHVVRLSGEPSYEDVRRVTVVGTPVVPKKLAKDYRKASKALENGNWRLAAAELTALVERWPVGTLEDGGEYRPKDLLVSALEGAGEQGLAKEVDRRRYEVVEAQISG